MNNYWHDIECTCGGFLMGIESENKPKFSFFQKKYFGVICNKCWKNVQGFNSQKKALSEFKKNCGYESSFGRKKKQ